MYIRPTFWPEAALLPEATFPWDLPNRTLSYLCIVELYERTSVRVYECTNIRAYERTSLRIATETRPIHNSFEGELNVPLSRHGRISP
jgi:hypothetical protein